MSWNRHQGYDVATLEILGYNPMPRMIIQSDNTFGLKYNPNNAVYKYRPDNPILSNFIENYILNKVVARKPDIMIFNLLRNIIYSGRTFLKYMAHADWPPECVEDCFNAIINVDRTDEDACTNYGACDRSECDAQTSDWLQDWIDHGCSRHGDWKYKNHYICKTPIVVDIDPYHIAKTRAQLIKDHLDENKLVVIRFSIGQTNKFTAASKIVEGPDNTAWYEARTISCDVREVEYYRIKEHRYQFFEDVNTLSNRSTGINIHDERPLLLILYKLGNKIQINYIDPSKIYNPLFSIDQRVLYTQDNNQLNWYDRIDCNW